MRDGYIATGFSVRRLLNVAGSWGALDTERRGNDSIGIDGGRQTKEEYASDEGLGEHFDIKRIKVIGMAAGVSKR